AAEAGCTGCRKFAEVRCSTAAATSRTRYREFAEAGGATAAAARAGYRSSAEAHNRQACRGDRRDATCQADHTSARQR
ncbi:MAG: hypothetical protein WCA56_16195, partial [Xanthobacteraceae bacterium]